MKRHRTDVFSLTFGLLFGLVFLWWLLEELSVDVEAGWLAVAGLAILGGTATAAAIAPAVTRRPRGGAPEMSSSDAK